MDAALDAWPVLQLTTQLLVAEFEPRVDKPSGQVGRRLVHDAEGLPCLQGIERSLGKDRCEPGEGGQLANDDAASLAHLSGGEIRRPGKSGRLSIELCRRQRIIGLVDIAAFGPAPTCVGDPRFERDDLIGALWRVRPADHVKHAGDVAVILLFLVLESILQIVVAIRKA